jgi:hypothetical protein
LLIDDPFATLTARFRQNELAGKREWNDMLFTQRWRCITAVNASTNWRIDIVWYDG